MTLTPLDTFLCPALTCRAVCAEPAAGGGSRVRRAAGANAGRPAGAAGCTPAERPPRSPGAPPRLIHNTATASVQGLARLFTGGLMPR